MIKVFERFGAALSFLVLILATWTLHANWSAVFFSVMASHRALSLASEVGGPPVSTHYPLQGACFPFRNNLTTNIYIHIIYIYIILQYYIILCYIIPYHIKLYSIIVYSILYTIYIILYIIHYILYILYILNYTLYIIY
jgi:hypothetical protein